MTNESKTAPSPEAPQSTNPQEKNMTTTNQITAALATETASKLSTTSSDALLISGMLPGSLANRLSGPDLAWGGEHETHGLVIVTETRQLAEYLDGYIRSPYYVEQEGELFLIVLDEDDCDEFERVNLGDLEKLENAEFGFLRSGEVIRADQGSDDFRNYEWHFSEEDAGQDGEPVWYNPLRQGEPEAWVTDK